MAVKLKEEVTKILQEYLTKAAPAIEFVRMLSMFANLTVTFGPSGANNPKATINTFADGDIKPGANGEPTGTPVEISNDATNRAIMIMSVAGAMQAANFSRSLDLDVNNCEIDKSLTVMDLVFQAMRLLYVTHKNCKDKTQFNVIKHIPVDEVQTTWELLVPRVQINETKGQLGKFKKELKELNLDNILLLFEAAAKASTVLQGSDLELGSTLHTLNRLATSGGTPDPFYDAGLRDSLPRTFKQLARRLDPETYRYTSNIKPPSNDKELIRLLKEYIAAVDANPGRYALSGGGVGMSEATRKKVKKAEELLSLVSDTLVEHFKKAKLCVEFVKQFATYANVTTSVQQRDRPLGSTATRSQVTVYDFNNVAPGANGRPSAASKKDINDAAPYVFALAVKKDNGDFGAMIDVNRKGALKNPSVDDLKFIDLFFQMLRAVRAGHEASTITPNQITSAHPQINEMKTLWETMVPRLATGAALGTPAIYNHSGLADLNEQAVRNLLLVLDLAHRAEASIQGSDQIAETLGEMNDKLASLCKQPAREPFTEAYQILRYVAPDTIRSVTRGIRNPAVPEGSKYDTMRDDRRHSLQSLIRTLASYLQDLQNNSQ